MPLAPRRRAFATHGRSRSIITPSVALRKVFLHQASKTIAKGLQLVTKRRHILVRLVMFGVYIGIFENQPFLPGIHCNEKLTFVFDFMSDAFLTLQPNSAFITLDKRTET